jgi:hypothetical protein
MPNLDIYTFAPSITLLMPLAGVGQSFRLYCPALLVPCHAGHRCRDL